MEFAQAARGSGSRRSTARRSTSRTAATSRCWSTRRRAGATSAASSRARTRHARDHGEPPPAVPLETLEEHAAGLVCLSGCARHGVHDEPTLRRLLAAFGRDSLRVELQRPFQRDDRARNRGLAGLAARLGVPAVATGQRPRARARARAAAGRVRRPAQPHDARRVGAAAARQHRARARLPGGDGGALRGPPARGRRGGARSPSGCAST